MEDRALLERLGEGPRDQATLAAAAGLAPAALRARLSALRAAGLPLEEPVAGRWALARPLDLLDPAVLSAALPPDASAQLDGLAVAWQVDSTNARLLAERPLAGPGMRVLLAEGQTAGRGRRGRAWVSPLGCHLYLSLACPFPGGMAAMAGLSVATGVLVATALETLGLAGIGLKWPNDLVGPEGKLGGILVESCGRPQGPALAVVGIGLNVHRPGAGAVLPPISQPWDCLDRLAARPLDRNAVAAALLGQLLPGLARFRHEGLGPFMPGFAARDVLAGRAVWLDNGAGDRTPALALGLAPDGSLRVREGSGERCVHAGEVSVRQQ